MGESRDVKIGVDIGGTETLVMAIDASGRILASTSFDTPVGGTDMVASITAKIRSMCEDVAITGIGVGTAGVVNEDGEITAASSSFADWVGFPVRKYFQNEFSVPVAVENDVNAFLLGELQYGAMAATPDVLGVMLGTGVGGAIALDRRIFRGGSGGAGEIGHIVADTQLLCTCGQYGHVEALASGKSIAQRYRLSTGYSCSAREVGERARSGDEIAHEIFIDAARALAAAIVTTVTLFDLTDVVVGGGVTKSWDLFAPHVEESLERNPPVSGRGVNIVLSSLGRNAVALGATALVPELATT